MTARIDRERRRPDRAAAADRAAGAVLADPARLAVAGDLLRRPDAVMLSVSTMTGDIVSGFKQTFHWQHLLRRVEQLPRPVRPVARVRR